MRLSTLFPTATLLISALLPTCASANDDTAFQVKLNPRERAVLEQMVCGKPFGVAAATIDARALEANATRADYADVKCQPHTQVNNQSVYYAAQCAQEGREWNCGRPALETIVPLKNRELLMRPGTVEINRAIHAVQKISSFGYFQGNSLDKALQSTCYLGEGNSPELVEISCRKWSIVVTFWCPQINAKSDCPRVIYMAEH